MEPDLYTEVSRLDLSPYLYPATKLDSAIQERVRRQYNGCCPLCSLSHTGVFRKDVLIYYIIPPTVKGCSQMGWLVDAGLIDKIAFERDDNLILLCRTHSDCLTYGSFTLCPSLDDLEILLDWEQQRRATDISGSTTRRASPLEPEALSGFFSLLYTYGVSDGRQEFPRTVTWTY
ncbi:hypothetical protein GY45DRAFT_154285 [Cubamyces sp. BRFM 1775]|nr:hypothetical protein GY45DRAFT_154285 [Cubamyces sp. BRFM 1775]